MTGGNTYETCPGTGHMVTRITAHQPSPRPNVVGSDGTGICPHCQRDISQRGGVAKRHKAAG